MYLKELKETVDALYAQFGKGADSVPVQIQVDHPDFCLYAEDVMEGRVEATCRLSDYDRVESTTLITALTPVRGGHTLIIKTSLE